MAKKRDQLKADRVPGLAVEDRRRSYRRRDHRQRAPRKSRAPPSDEELGESFPFFFFFPSFFLSLFYSKSEIWIFVILYRWAEWGRVVRSHPDPTGAADTFSSYTPPFYLSIININTTSFHA